MLLLIYKEQERSSDPKASLNSLSPNPPFPVQTGIDSFCCCCFPKCQRGHWSHRTLSNTHCVLVGALAVPGLEGLCVRAGINRYTATVG
uniref:Uncharacterized protein n=1 Tax=Malurus cyaneus samueli TaxID=2593467 RepID=A0A8C5TMY4_9PASS